MGKEIIWITVTGAILLLIGIILIPFNRISSIGFMTLGLMAEIFAAVLVRKGKERV